MQVNNKAELRKHFKKIRSEMDKKMRSDFDKNIFENVCSLNEYINCRQVLVYVSSEIEVGTRQLMEKAFSEKEVLCPRCVDGTNIMYFYKVSSFEELEKGSFGILEPRIECEKAEVFDNAVCIVPALSFDRYGFRLGFGKGFYDRFLENFSGAKIGLCYENCLSQTLPSDIYDINVDKIATEERTIVARKDDKINGR